MNLTVLKMTFKRSGASIGFLVLTLFTACAQNQKPQPIQADQVVASQQPVEAVAAAEKPSQTGIERQTSIHSSSGELRSVTTEGTIAPNEGTIEPRSGRLFLNTTDLIVQAGAIQLEVQRSYWPSPQKSPGLLGQRWRMNWESHLVILGPMVVLEEGLGTVVFVWDEATKRYRSATGDELVLSDGALRTKTDGTKERFDAEGRLVERDLRNGNKVQIHYDAKNRLARIEGPFRSFLQLTVSPEGRLTRVDSSDGSSVSYVYGIDTPPGNSSESFTVSYQYDPEDAALTRIDHPQVGRVEFSYDARRRVISRKWSDETSEQYEYDDKANTVRHIDPARRTTTTNWGPGDRTIETADSLGHKTVIERDEAGRTNRITGATGQSVEFAYDPLGRIVRIKDSVANTTQITYHGESRLVASVKGAEDPPKTYAYDAEGNLLSVKRCDCDSMETEYFPNGLVKKSHSCDGRQYSYEYDEHGRLATMTAATGQQWKFQYDPQGNLIRETNPQGGVTVRTFDRSNHLTTLTDPAGATSRYEYNAAGLLTRRIDAMGGTTLYQYNPRGRLTSITNAVGRTTTYDYDPDGRLKSVANAAGETYRYEYDAMGKLRREIDPLGGVTTRTRDALGRMIGWNDAAGGAISLELSPAGVVSRRVDTDGVATQYHYDPQGRIIEQIDGAGRVTQFEYSDQGRVTRIRAKGRPQMSFEYDSTGRLVSASDGQQSVKYEYDAHGNRRRETRADGRDIQFDYDALGNLVGWKDSFGASESIEYDAANRPVAIRDSSRATTRHRFDLAGNLVSVTDPLGHVQQRKYSLIGELQEVNDEAVGRAIYEYNAAGRMAKAQRPSGGSTQYQYDPLGNPVKVTDPLGQQTKLVYDAAGRLVSKLDAKGQTTTYSYDAAGRLRQKHLTDGTIVSFTYDSEGRVTEINDGAYPVRYAYDDDGNRIKVQYPAIKRTLTYEYNLYGQRTKMFDSEGRTIAYSYDGLRRLTEIRLNDGGTISFQLDAQGRAVKITYPNGVERSNEYDAAGRFTKIAYVSRDGQMIAGWSYDYDIAGNRVQIAKVDGSTNRYRYDAAGQVIEESWGTDRKQAYHYGPGGNRTTLSLDGHDTIYRYDADDRVIAAGDETFAWDANGNLIERKSSDGVTKYEYNGEDQLVAVTRPDGLVIRFGYSPTGQRAWRSEGGRKSYYVCDGPSLIAELDSDLKLQAEYVHGPQIDQPLVVTSGGEQACYHADSVGSIANITDQNGKAIASYEYDAFGNLIGQPSAIIAKQFGFTAREFDAATGLYYYRARYYDTKLGRFLSRDPIAAPASQPIRLNPYLYARNNPLKYVDPMGTADTIVGTIGDIAELPSPYTAAQLGNRIYVNRDLGAAARAGNAQEVARIQKLMSDQPEIFGPDPKPATPPSQGVVRGPRGVPQPDAQTIDIPKPDLPGPDVPRPDTSESGVLESGVADSAIPEPGVSGAGTNWGLVGRAAGLAVGGGLVGANYYACIREGHSITYCSLEAGAGFAVGGLASAAIAAAAGTAAPAILTAGAVLATLNTAERVGNLPAVEAAQQTANWTNANVNLLSGVVEGLDRKINALDDVHASINKKRRTAADQADSAANLAQSAEDLLSKLKSSSDDILDAAKACKQASSIKDEVENHATTAASEEKVLETELDAADAAAGSATTPPEMAKLKAAYEKGKARVIDIASHATEARRRNEVLKQSVEKAQAARDKITAAPDIVTMIADQAESASQFQETIKKVIAESNDDTDRLKDQIAQLRAQILRVRTYFPADNEDANREFARLNGRLDSALEWKPEASAPEAAGRADTAVASARKAASEAKALLPEIKAYELCDGVSADKAVEDADNAKTAAALRLAASANLSDPGSTPVPMTDKPGDPPQKPNSTESNSDQNPPMTTARIKVPLVLMMDEAGAKAALTAAGLVAARQDCPTRTPSAAEELKVQRQDPNVGEDVAPGSTVTLTIYRRFGDNPPDVPKVPGMVRVASVLTLKPDVAKQLLQGDKLNVAFAPSAVPPPSKDLEYTIQREDPPGGTDVKPESTVLLTVYGPFPASDGTTDPPQPESDKDHVPDVAGLSKTQAITKIESYGLRVSGIEVGGKAPKDKQPGTARGTVPAAGSMLPKDKAIVLQIYDANSMDPKGGDQDATKLIGKWVAVKGNDVAVGDQINVESTDGQIRLSFLYKGLKMGSPDMYKNAKTTMQGGTIHWESYDENDTYICEITQNGGELTGSWTTKTKDQTLQSDIKMKRAQ